MKWGTKKVCEQEVSMQTPPVSFFTSSFFLTIGFLCLYGVVILYIDPALLHFLPLLSEGEVRKAWLWHFLLPKRVLEEPEPGGLVHHCLPRGA